MKSQIGDGIPQLFQDIDSSNAIDLSPNGRRQFRWARISAGFASRVGFVALTSCGLTLQ
jgi:hypothetical protein